MPKTPKGHPICRSTLPTLSRGLLPRKRGTRLSHPGVFLVKENDMRNRHALALGLVTLFGGLLLADSAEACGRCKGGRHGRTYHYNGGGGCYGGGCYGGGGCHGGGAYAGESYPTSPYAAPGYAQPVSYSPGYATPQGSYATPQAYAAPQVAAPAKTMPVPSAAGKTTQATFAAPQPAIIAPPAPPMPSAPAPAPTAAPAPPAPTQETTAG